MKMLTQVIRLGIGVTLVGMLTIFFLLLVIALHQQQHHYTNIEQWRKTSFAKNARAVVSLAQMAIAVGLIVSIVSWALHTVSISF